MAGGSDENGETIGHCSRADHGGGHCCALGGTMVSGESDVVAGPNKQSQEAELSALFTRHREQLRRMVQLRLDRCLRARVDASDVLQEAFLEASLRYDEYRRAPSMSPMLWLRFVVGQRLLLLHRKHLGVKA